MPESEQGRDDLFFMEGGFSLERVLIYLIQLVFDSDPVNLPSSVYVDCPYLNPWGVCTKCAVVCRICRNPLMPSPSYWIVAITRNNVFTSYRNMYFVVSLPYAKCFCHVEYMGRYFGAHDYKVTYIFLQPMTTTVSSRWAYLNFRNEQCTPHVPHGNSSPKECLMTICIHFVALCYGNSLYRAIQRHAFNFVAVSRTFHSSCKFDLIYTLCSKI